MIQFWGRVWSDLRSRNFWVQGVLAGILASALVALGVWLFVGRGQTAAHESPNATASVGPSAISSSPRSAKNSPTPRPSETSTRVPPTPSPTNVVDTSGAVAATIESGASVPIELARAGQIVSWHFAGREGEMVLARVDRDPTGNVQPALALYDPFGQPVVQTNSVDRPNESYAQFRVTLVSTGEYRLEAKDRTGKGLGKAVVRFSIDPFASIEFDKPISDRIALAGQLKLYVFPATAGQGVTVRVDRDPSGNLQPQIALYDPFGEKVVEGNSVDRPAESYAQISADLVHTGEFLILVNDRTGRGIGDYMVILSVR